MKVRVRMLSRRQRFAAWAWDLLGHLWKAQHVVFGVSPQTARYLDYLAGWRDRERKAQ